MLSSHPLFRRFENHFDFRWPTTYKKFVIEWHAQGGSVWFRPRGADKRMLWHALDLLSWKRPEQAFSDAMQEQQLHRALPLPQNQFVFWNRTGGLVYKSGDEAAAVFAFPNSIRWKSDQDLLLGSCSDVAEHIQTSVPVWTDFKRAQLLVENNFDGWFAIEVKDDAIVSFRQLMYALFEIYDVGKDYYLFDNTKKLSGFGKIPDAIVDVLKQRFQPVYHRRRRLRCFSGWHNRGEISTPSTRRESCSAHERLEMTLLVREFLRDKMAPKEIDSLLPKF